MPRSELITNFSKRKNAGPPLVCLTAYTFPMARILAAHVDLLLVGDSVGTVLYGHPDTTYVDLETMIRHGAAVMRAKPEVPVIVDMPFGKYEHDSGDAVQNARRIMDDTGCDAVKLEGGRPMAHTIRQIVDAGIPVMGHIGLQPQSVVREGGYKIKGKTPQDSARLMDDARAVQNAGAFALVIEGTIDTAARDITAHVKIPTIGIGAGAGCDGQILVSEDMLGLLEGMHRPKFVRVYENLSEKIHGAAEKYAQDVRQGKFPSDNETYMKKD